MGDNDAVGSDRWLDWLRRGRDAGSSEVRRRSLQYLQPIYERVLDSALIQPGDRILEVGAGEGQLGLQGLERSGPSGRLVLSDISSSVIDHLRALLPAELTVGGQVAAEVCPAETLAGIDDHSVDVVLVRSVLIYVDDVAAAFVAMARVLAPGGRLSLFEPLWKFFPDDKSPVDFFGRQLADAADEMQVVLGHYRDRVFSSSEPTVTIPSLVSAAEQAGLTTIRAQVDITSDPLTRGDDAEVERALHGRPNPNAPSPAEVAQQVLAPDAARRFLAALEASVRNGTGRHRDATAYLTARQR